MAEKEKGPLPEGDVTQVAMPAFTGLEKGNQQYCHVPVLMTLIGESDPMRLIIEAPEVVIGRSKDVDFSLRDSTTSRQHAKLVYVNCQSPDARPSVFLYDLNSRNGVMVNGVEVRQHVPLRDNARITIGDIQMGYYVMSIPKKDLGGTAGSRAGDTPVGDAAEAPKDAKETSPPTRTPGPTGTNPGLVGAKRIAIIESDFEAASDLRQRLEATGRYAPLVFRKLDNALANFESKMPDMILLDGEMPDSPCIEVCQRLKEDGRLRGVPIILLFTTLDPQLVRNGLKAGAQSYLIKPIENLTQLTNRIDIHMNINRMMGGLGH